MFSRLTRPPRSPLELALLKRLRINLLCGSKHVDEIEEKRRREAW